MVAEHVDNHSNIFVTTAMAEILLNQNMLAEARKIIEQLIENEPENPRHIALGQRLKAMVNHGERDPIPTTPKGSDFVSLSGGEKTLHVAWEVMDESVALAKRKARYAGQCIVRLFSAVPGPRGVRKSTKDITINPGAARIELTGLPFPAVHVAAVGFLSNTGEFVPLAESETIVASNDISNETP